MAVHEDKVPESGVDPRAEGPGPGSVSEPAHATPANTTAPLYLVDGFNVLHAVVLKGRDRRRWWSKENQRKVVELAERFERQENTAESSAVVLVVFDAARRDSERLEGEHGVDIAFAPSADDFIVAEVETEQATHPERSVFVVSSDRPLLDRSRHRGAARVSPWEFLHRSASSS